MIRFTPTASSTSTRPALQNKRMRGGWWSVLVSFYPQDSACSMPVVRPHRP